jgi:tetratricopeptide (TPR) repeat protein/tRNA A-37 threonylcarbamoyl transferase component Bud32
MLEETPTATETEGQFERVLADILVAEERGEQLDLSAVMRTTPALEPKLREFFRNRAGFDRLALGRAISVPLDLPPGSRIAGYEIIEEIDRGGRGIVYRVRDAELNRSLAVKVLLPKLRDDADAVRRFIEERQITAQLQHPGIVPVHSVGNLPDGRPYFAMKLVEGKTLAALLEERVRATSPQRRQGRDEEGLEDSAHPTKTDLPRFLSIFLQICQAVAYAHSRGVIHRDLKPKNVMVGAFAEVQVMDWGLGKVRADAAAQFTVNPDAIETVRTGATGASTEDGAVAGTYAYMSPEQAKGQVDRVDERADVFGLGAVLCELLTGLPPYGGASAWEVHRRAAAGNLADAFRRLDQSYADAELIALAKDCLAVERDARPIDAGAVSNALALYQADVEERLRKAQVERAAAQVKVAEERKRRKLAIALASALLVVVVLGAAAGLWVQYVEAERRANRAQLMGEQRQAVEAALEKIAGLMKEGRWKEAQAVLDQARERLGDSGPADLIERVQCNQADLALTIRLNTIRQNRSAWVDGQFDNRTAARDYEAAFREAGLLRETEDSGAVADRVRNTAIAEQLVAALDDWAQVTGRGAWLLEVARRADPDPWRDRFRNPGLRGQRAALETLADELLREPAKLSKVNPQILQALGTELLWSSGDPVPLLKAAQAEHPNDFWLNFQLGFSLSSVKKWDEAIGYYRAALAVQPESIVVHNNLGNALSSKGLLDEAIRELRTAIQLDPKFAVARYNLGIALRDNGQLDEAIQESGAAVQLDPNNAKRHVNLGIALRGKGQLDAAIKEFRRAIELDPNLARAHDNLGNALKSKGLLDEAIREHRTAIELDPKDATSYYHLGVTLLESKQLDEAILQYRAAIKLGPNIVQAHVNLGIALKDKKQLDEAIREYHTAIALDPEFALAHHNLGVALRDKGELDAAIQEFRTAIKLDSKLATAHDQLGVALEAKQQMDAAIQEYRRAIQLQDTLASAHCNLGLLLLKLRKPDEAKNELEYAVRLGPKDHINYYNLGNVYLYQKRFHEAARAYRTTIELNPGLAQARWNLGVVLQEQGHFSAALESMRRACEVGEHTPGWAPRGLAEGLKRAERLEELDSKLPAVLDRTVQVGGPKELMEFARFARHRRERFAAAAQLFVDYLQRHPDWASYVPDEPPFLGDQPPYYAAASALMAARGDGDGAELTDEQRANLRKQALAWMREHLAFCENRVRNKGFISQVHYHLAFAGKDGSFAGVRDEKQFANLPVPERSEWSQFWTDLARLREKCKLAGEWFMEGRKEEPCAVFQQGRALLLVNQRGEFATAVMSEPKKFTVKGWEEGLRGELAEEGKKITWSNGTTWLWGSEKTNNSP